MMLRQIMEELPHFLDAGVPVEIGSAPGAGKSESIDQLVTQLSNRDSFEWGICKIFIATQTPVDLLGYLVPGHADFTDPITKEITRTRVSEFTMPLWMISDKGVPMNHYKRGVVVFEEWDKGEPDVKKSSAEIILNGKAGPWKLHSGIGRICLVNRTEDRSGSTKNFDFIINRRAEFTILADVEGWREWALVNNIDPLFVAFASKYPEVVFANKIPDKQAPFCTPRSLVKLAQVLPLRKDGAGKMKMDPVTTEIITGMIGQAAGLQLAAWIRLRHETPDWEDILKDPTGIELPSKPDAQLMVCYECAHRVDTKTAAKCVSFIKRLPAQFSVTFAKAAVRRNYDLINTQAFVDWVAKNASLLNAIGGAK